MPDKPDSSGTRAGLWSTVHDAVQAGWGPTIRLLTVLVCVGLLVHALATSAGLAGLVDLLTLGP